MNFIATKLQDCYIIEPKIITDARGYFMESFNEKTFANGVGQNVHFVQDNQSFSTKGVLRGLHYQCGAHAQAKLVRVLQGEVLDVAVDIRENSPTFGKFVTVELSEDNKRQLFIPRGFLHGFSVLSETAVFSYKCDNLYCKSAEIGVHFNDADIGIDWQIPKNKIIISAKDKDLGGFKDVAHYRI